MNNSVVDMVCLTYLLQTIAKIVLGEVGKELKLVKIIHLSISSLGDPSTKLFDIDKCCYNGQWQLASPYFKCWSCVSTGLEELKTCVHLFCVHKSICMQVKCAAILCMLKLHSCTNVHNLFMQFIILVFINAHNLQGVF